MPTQADIRQRVTEEIIESLKSGEIFWRRPWKLDPNSGAPQNAVSQRRYSGVNPLLLQIHSQRFGFQSKHWATFNAWKSVGGSVMKRPVDVPNGQWGCRIVFAKRITKTTTDENGDETKETFYILKEYVVFCIDQVHGNHLDHLRVGHGIQNTNPSVTFEQADELVRNSGAIVRHGGNKALFDPNDDHIQMPFRQQFDGSSYYESLFHEMIHWAEGPKRLNQQRTTSQSNYALGELVAELGSCFLCKALGIPLSEDLGNHAAYLQSWLKALENDHSFIFRASNAASKATDYLLGFLPTHVEETEPVFAQ